MGICVDGSAFVCHMPDKRQYVYKDTDTLIEYILLVKNIVHSPVELPLE